MKYFRTALLASLMMITNLINLNYVTTGHFKYLYIFVLLIIAIYTLKNVPILSPTFFFLMFLVMLFYLQPLAHYALGLNIITYPIEIQMKYAVITFNGTFLFLIGHNLFYDKRTQYIVSLNGLRFRNRKRTTLILLLMIVSIILIYTNYIGFRNVLNSSRVSLKTTNVYLKLLLNISSYLFTVLIIIVVSSNKDERIFRMSTWLAIFVVIEIVYALLYRTRSNFVQHILAGLVIFYYKPLIGNSSKRSQKYKLRSFLMILVLVVVLLIAITFRFARGMLEPGNSLRDFSVNLKYFIELSLSSGDLGYSSTVMELISIFPSSYPYLLGQSYYRLLFVFIPRFIWPHKPQNTQRIIANILMPGVLEQTIPPGIIGDTYINFGLYGFIVLFFFGILFGILDRPSRRYDNLFIWSTSSVWVFHLVRGGFTNPLIIFFVFYVVSRTLNKINNH